MRLVRKWKRHLSFSTRERTSFLVLLVILGVSTIVTIYVHFGKGPVLAERAIYWEDHSLSGYTETETQTDTKAFYFDPNSLSFDSLCLLGIPEKTAATILKYREKGGVFRRPEDLSKVYGMRQNDVERLVPFVRLPEKVLPNQTDKYQTPGHQEVVESTNGLSSFDPNQADVNLWMQMGLSKKVASTAVNYVQKGGRFRSPDDLKKIYGFSTLDYERIAPWVYIPIDEAVPVHRAESKSELPLPGQMEINKATATDLTHCGLSTATAWAVINYRDKLGGFYSREQFAEIKKLSDEEWQTLASCVRVDPTAIITLHINSAEFNQLANHPYLSDKFARAIIHYRDSTGIYRSVNELVRAYRVSPQYLEKLKFYLSL